MSADLAADAGPAADPAVVTNTTVTGASQDNDVTADDFETDGPMADVFKEIAIAADEHKDDAINPGDENGNADGAETNGGNAVDTDAKKADEEKVSGRDTDRRHGNHRQDSRQDSWRSSRAYKGYDRKNVKSRYDQQPETDDPVEIRRRVEFYLSDSNLSSDFFLYKHVGGSENHAIDLKVITDFKRMACFKPYSAIVKALKESDKLELLDEDKPNQEKLRRKVPLSTELGTEFEQVRRKYEELAIPKTVYVKGFGDEDKDTQIALENFFLTYGACAVRLRRIPNGIFKGSVFVEFDDEQSAKQFLDLEPKPTWNGKELIIKSKAAYSDEKLEQYALRQLLREAGDAQDKRQGRPAGGKRGRGGNRGHANGRKPAFGRNGGGSRANQGSRDINPDRLRNENWRELASGKKDDEKAEKDHETGDVVQQDQVPDAEASAARDASKDDAQVGAVAEVEKANSHKDKDGENEPAKAPQGKKRAARDDFEDGNEAKKAKADDA